MFLVFFYKVKKEDLFFTTCFLHCKKYKKHKKHKKHKKQEARLCKIKAINFKDSYIVKMQLKSDICFFLIYGVCFLLRKKTSYFY